MGAKFIAFLLSLAGFGAAVPLAIERDAHRPRRLSTEQELHPHFLVKCQIGSDHQREFLWDQIVNSNLDSWDGVPKAAGNVTILATKHQLRKLYASLPCLTAVDIKQLEERDSKLVASGLNDKDFFANYRPYSSIVKQMKTYKSTAALNVTMHVIARSHERRDIHVIRLHSTSTKPSRKIWVSCGQHAREWVASAACMHVVDHFHSAYGKDKQVTRMLDNYELLIAPLINPDGYEYSRNHYRYWRKNRRHNGGLDYGVDLNRNWDGMWGDVGTSNDPTSVIYRGPFAGSEPEVNQTAKYILSLSGLAAGLDIHSFGQLILRNYGYTTQPCPDEARFANIGDTMAQKMNAVYGTNYVSQRSGGFYPTMGAMDDWFYLSAKVLGMTIELRDQGSYGFLLPPSQIIPTGQELAKGILALGDNL